MGLRSFNFLSICSGDGGLDLGVRLALRTARAVCYIEHEAFAIEVLARRMEEGFLDQAPVWSDLRTFDGKPWRNKIYGIVGGYPCQPWSFVGQRLGQDDPRHLWPAIARIIKDTGASYCFFENVEGHLSLGFPEVRAELRAMGFRVAAGLFSAAEMGGSHVRKRLFILAAKEEVLADAESLRGLEVERLQSNRVLPSLGLNSEGDGDKRLPVFPPKPHEIEKWEKIVLEKPELEPALHNMVDESTLGLDRSGSARRIGQLRLLGNSVIPCTAAFALSVLLSRLASGGD